MITIKKYVKAESLEQAYQLNQSRSNRIIGGMLWMKMGSRNIHTAIDLSGVVSDKIEEKSDAFVIGAMASLHQMEVHQGLLDYTGGAIKESLRHIVGVQFRNGATVGGSIYGRFGFSDVLTMLLALDTYVILYKRGMVSLEKFAAMPYDNDLLLSIVIKKVPIRVAYSSVRNSKTDFPVLTCAVSVTQKGTRAVIGARPKRAVVFQGEDSGKEMDWKMQAEQLSHKVYREITTGSNMRASGEYRRHLSKVLTKRTCLKALEQGGDCQ